MPVLHNRISNEELKARMLAETEPRTTVSFTNTSPSTIPKRFATASTFSSKTEGVRPHLRGERGHQRAISVPQHNFDAFKAALFASHPALDQVRLNIALEDDGKSFGAAPPGARAHRGRRHR